MHTLYKVIVDELYWPSKERGAAIVTLLAQRQVYGEHMSANVLGVNWTKLPSYHITCLKYRAACQYRRHRREGSALALTVPLTIDNICIDFEG